MLDPGTPPHTHKNNYWTKLYIFSALSIIHFVTIIMNSYNMHPKFYTYEIPHDQIKVYYYPFIICLLQDP